MSDAHAQQFVPVILEGAAIRLEPMQAHHADLFFEATGDARHEIFRWYPWRLHTREDFRWFVDRGLADQARGWAVPFATVERSSGTVIGSTWFFNIDAANRRVEIGSTWLVPAWQRTVANTEAKFLMLRHAFEHWGCVRVELKTDARNQRSRAAILRIGAKEEGILRQHMVCWDGHKRDTAYFSILDSEWPAVKAQLAARLARR